MRWLASSCGGRRGAHLYFSTLNSRRWKNNQFNARQTTQCGVCIVCVRAPAARICAVAARPQRSCSAQLTACVIDILPPCVRNSRIHPTRMKRRASERSFLCYCKEDFCRAAALIIKSAHTHNNNNTKNICALGVGVCAAESY